MWSRNTLQPPLPKCIQKHCDIMSFLHTSHYDTHSHHFFLLLPSLLHPLHQRQHFLLFSDTFFSFCCCYWHCSFWYACLPFRLYMQKHTDLKILITLNRVNEWMWTNIKQNLFKVCDLCAKLLILKLLSSFEQSRYWLQESHRPIPKTNGSYEPVLFNESPSKKKKACPV